MNEKLIGEEMIYRLSAYNNGKSDCLIPLSFGEPEDTPMPNKAFKPVAPA
jgi:hypothetical protein